MKEKCRSRIHMHNLYLHETMSVCKNLYYIISMHWDRWVYLSYICYILKKKKTALHCAAVSGHASVVKGLIRAGADVNAVDDVSLIYMYVCTNVHNYVYTPIFTCVYICLYIRI